MAKSTDADWKTAPVIIQHQGKERHKLMASLGCPGQDTIPLHTRIDVSDYLISMEPDLPSVANKPISTKKQLDSLRKLLRNPLRFTGTIGISSYPSDSRAKYLAQMIMSAAIDEYQANRRHYGTKSLPKWHRVYGNFKDSLRDIGKPEDVSMLIISNIHDESSSIKIEKIRDLLEMYSSVPKIVVKGGAQVIDLFTYRLSYPMMCGFYIGPDNIIHEKT